MVEEISNEKEELLRFLCEFNSSYEQEEKKLPYHINLIDELRANENAHSRILEKLLKQYDPITKRYEILESFIKYIIESHRDKEEFSRIIITDPIITQEEKRIDLWIRDNGKYAIVLENKVGWAKDQPRQLERYIDHTKQYGFKENSIYVLYLSPTYEKEPEKQTWGKYDEHDIRKKRFLNLSFKDDILSWLKEYVYPNIRLKDKYLSSAIEQYIDHLEGIFSLRTMNEEMNMVLQRLVKENLGIDNLEPEEAFNVISKRKQEIETILGEVQKGIQKEIDKKYFLGILEMLKMLNLDVVDTIDTYDCYESRAAGVNISNELVVWIGKDDGIGEGRLFCQLNSRNKTILSSDVKEIFEGVLTTAKGNSIEASDTEIWKYLDDGVDALEYLKKVVKELTRVVVETVI